MEYEIKTEIKSEIKQGVIIDAITKVVINKNNIASLEWIDNGKEMKYNGELYDIIKRTFSATETIYYCINDKKEDALNVVFDHHIGVNIVDNKPLKNNTAKKLLDDMAKIYFSDKPSFLFELRSLKKNFSSNILFYTPYLIETDSPPPEYV